MAETVTIPAADLYRMQVQAEWNGWIGQWIFGLLVWVAVFQFVQLVLKLTIRTEMKTTLDTAISYLQATKVYTSLTQAAVKETAAVARESHAAVKEVVQQVKESTAANAASHGHTPVNGTEWDGRTERRSPDSGRLPKQQN